MNTNAFSRLAFWMAATAIRSGAKLWFYGNPGTATNPFRKGGE